jgi:hypothetical protein
MKNIFESLAFISVASFVLLLTAIGTSPNIFSGEIAYAGQPNAVSSGEIAYTGQSNAISSGEIAYVGQRNAVSSGEIAYIGQRYAISSGEIPSVGLFSSQIPQPASLKSTIVMNLTKPHNATTPENLTNQSMNITQPLNMTNQSMNVTKLQNMTNSTSIGGSAA